MFKTAIHETPFSSSTADSCFPDISANTYNGDTTFVSTLRALIAPRRPEGDSAISAIVRQNNPYGTGTRGYTLDRMFLDTADLRENTIFVQGINSGDSEVRSAWMNFCDAEIEKYGFEKLEKITEFYRRSFRVSCWIRTEKRQSVMFVESLDMSKLHELQASILAFLPWYFNPEDGVSDTEMDLIKSLREKTPDKYLAAIAKLAESIDFRTKHIQNQLRGFETFADRETLNGLEDDIVNLYDQINSLNREIRNRLSQINTTNIRILGLQAKLEADTGESEIMDYFVRNKHLVLEYARGSTVSFSVDDCLLYYDEDAARAAIQNRNSYVYTQRYDSSISEDDMRRLMTEIFLNQNLKIHFCAGYDLDLGSGVEPHYCHRFPYECRNDMPNPHIDRYNCIGNYSTEITRLMRDHDYIGVIEQCMASCRSLNFNDPPVMKEFMKQMYGVADTTKNVNCIELPDGSITDPNGAIAWLKKQEEENHE